jgi:alpha-tubulin suppressor-like RCC1 family protein
VKNDGSVFGWGTDLYGQLGGMGSHQTPMRLTGLSSIVDASSGPGQASLFLRSDGTMVSMGDNGYGQLGIGVMGGVSTPTAAPGITNGKAVISGYSDGAVLNQNGTVSTFGAAAWGTLGTAQPLSLSGNQLSPVSVMSTLTQPLTNVVSIVGADHFTVLKDDGTVWAWGRNSSGELGNGESGDQFSKSSPVQVRNDDNTLLTQVTQLAASRSLTVALKADGSIVAWGSNVMGELGIAGSPLVPRAGTATHITSFGTDNVGVAAGEYWTAAVKSDGTVWVTGNNSNGALGRLQNGVGGVINTPVPLQVPNLTNVAKLFGCARGGRLEE